MGNTSSTTVECVENYVERTNEIQKHLSTMKEEVKEQQPLITENILQQVTQVQDAIVIRYSELKDKNKIVGHIKEIFQDDVALEFLTDAAGKMIAVFNSSSQMTDLLRWNQVKKVLKCDGRTIGMELHYKVMITDEKISGMITRGTTETVVILAYKFIQNALDVNPNVLPNKEKLRNLRF